MTKVEFTQQELRVLQYSLHATFDALDPANVPDHDIEQFVAQTRDYEICRGLLTRLFGSTEEPLIGIDDV